MDLSPFKAIFDNASKLRQIHQQFGHRIAIPYEYAVLSDSLSLSTSKMAQDDEIDRLKLIVEVKKRILQRARHLRSPSQSGPQNESDMVKVRIFVSEIRWF